MKLAVGLTVLAACSFEHGASPGSSIDAQVDAPPGCSSSFSSQVDTCLLASDQDLVLSGTNTYDTTMGTLKAGTTELAITRSQLAGKAGPLEVLVVRNFNMTANARLRAVGARPLAIVAFGTITLDGSAIIDVSVGGAGARPTCAGAAVAGTTDAGGGGGGGGGAFGDKGGNGGNGNGDSTIVSGGPGGNPEAIPDGPLGGCSGAKGGNGDDTGGIGGAGGGAIYLVAATRIDLAAGSGINAGGAGGGGGGGGGSDGDAGGGGGGAGGMIMIESKILRSMGTIAANGGAGGEGSGDGDGGMGGAAGLLGPGAAEGGRGSSPTGSDGGNGGAQVATLGTSVTSVLAGGGGGGGGSVGYIVIVSDDKMVAQASPAAN